MPVSLPIDPLLPRLRETLAEASCVLLQAPPGAGKTTRVPPALLDCTWREGRKIVMLEPRRLAARAAARFMAGQIGEPVGGTVGFRTRLESKVSADTVIDVVTEGILLRQLQADPELADVACVLFDEFHERSLNADLGLALVRESQAALRPDLRVVVMSATLDTAPLAKLLDDAPVLTSEGRSFPVEVSYRPPRREQRPDDAAAAAVRDALAAEPGSVLVFLPGVGEIKRVEERLAGTLPDDTDLCPLYGALNPAQQDAAIAPAPEGRRKVVLATAIAETSLTIEGVRIVIDAGLERRPKFDPGSGMTRLITERVSRSSAEQRRGRAGRLEPGRCIRLWSEGEQARLKPHAAPEILEADLAPTVLQLAQWGATDPGDLDWLDPPPRAHWDQAVDLLEAFDALDENGRITAHGRALLEPGLDPRLAQLLVGGRERRLGRTAAALAALLSDRDPLPRDAGSDLELRLRALEGKGLPGVHRGRLQQARQLMKRLTRTQDREAIDPHAAGRLLALAWPDRIAMRRPGGPARFRLANGRGAWLPDDDPLAGSEFLVAAELDGREREAKIFLAARVTRDELEADPALHVADVEVSDWDEARGAVVVRRQRRLGALVLEETVDAARDPEAVQRGLLAAVRKRGLDALDGAERTKGVRQRIEWLRRHGHADWPAFDDETLLAELEDWLGPFLPGITRWKELAALDLRPALEHRLGHDRKQVLDREAPVAIDVPEGSRIRLDYGAEPGPALAVKLQAVFGWSETPRVANGRAPVVLHLLSPAQRPVAVTSDLASFWANGYPDVVRDMRGRYPKHPWPDDPMGAEATMRTKRGSAGPNRRK
ncbi:ATP-dependent helicase HrpB [Wenzhouxiangella sp. XN79A]|uniref:ATP-dependent helicase HrpB n=1 Tax=Wenzhouxiangella sp. XN79A TaxID=2724193 RepID=UPI00144AD86A|nr:ATP-dependent helicase HrpB [Wenzhouxiangella sp. XN79A]NKI33949.1 ATP-dependent helicase HrpB [Wenzhouxiangella sp. XN79A]